MSNKKQFLIGVGVGVACVLVVEIVAIVIVGRSLIKTPEDIAQTLKVPPIPSSMDAEYNLTLKTTDGNSVDVSSLKGRVVFLSFWKPNCVSCKAQLPSIQHLYEMAKGKDIEFVLAAVGDKALDARKVAEEYNVTAPISILQGECPAMYEGKAPVTFILSPDGKVAYKQNGPVLWDNEATLNFLCNLKSNKSESSK